MRIEVISGSPRANSVTIRVAKHLFERLQKDGHEVGMIDVREWPFPAYQQSVFSQIETAPEDLQPVVARMLAADAFVIVTPEYNGTYTAALKNLFDHFPKQARKVFALATASPGALGGARATQQLLLLVPALFGITSPHLLITPQVEQKFDADGVLIDAGFQKSVDNFLQEFIWLAQKVRG